MWEKRSTPQISCNEYDFSDLRWNIHRPVERVECFCRRNNIRSSLLDMPLQAQLQFLPAFLLRAFLAEQATERRQVRNNKNTEWQRKVFALDFKLTWLCVSVFLTVCTAVCSGVLAFLLSLCFSLWRSCCFSSSFLCRAKTVSSWVTVCCKPSPIFLIFLSSFLHCAKTLIIMCVTFVNAHASTHIFLLQWSSQSTTFFLTWWQQHVPALSCGGWWCPAAPTAAASCSASPPRCAPVSPAALLAATPSGEPAAPSARPGTSLPAAYGLQSDMGQQINRDTRGMRKYVR